jgi:predicted metal-dependent RNase
MDKKFTLQEGVNAIPQTEFSTFEEKYVAVSNELNIAIERMIHDNQLDISKGIAKIVASKDSALSQIDEKIAKRYTKETGWKIAVEKTVNIEVSTPTYIYNIVFKDSKNKPIADKAVKLRFKDVNERDVEISNAGTTNSTGNVILNLTEILSKRGYHPHYCDSFKITVSDNTFEFMIEDTENKEKNVVLKLKAE